jgi:rhomboid-like protein
LSTWTTDRCIRDHPTYITESPEFGTTHRRPINAIQKVELAVSLLRAPFRGPLVDMSNAIWVAWRIPCSGLRSSSVLPPVTFRPVCRDLRITPSLYNSASRRLFSSLNTSCQIPNRPNTLRLFPRHSAFTSVQRRTKKTAAPVHPEPDSESLIRPLTDLEIKAIFGHRTPVSKKLANRTLEALQAQRLEGTLDLALPLDVARAVPQSQLDICLEWLRVNYPVDEDAAIMARIEREDREAEEKLVRRAEQLGLYKPQSGSYEAELGEENSPYGKSVLKEAREQNEKYLLAEKERKRQKWLEGENEEREKLQRQMEANTSLQQYQESALTEGMLFVIFNKGSD